jgi:hypothetical protein
MQLTIIARNEMNNKPVYASLRGFAVLSNRRPRVVVAIVTLLEKPSPILDPISEESWNRPYRLYESRFDRWA